MKKLFEVIFLAESLSYLKKLEKKHYEKILYNIRKSQIEIDASLFKKLNDNIRTLYQGLQHRMLAFWDKSGGGSTFVIVTHGFIKKRSSVPGKEIKKAEQVREKYFADKKIKETWKLIL